MDVGAKFDAYEALVDAVKKWEQENLTALYKRGSRKIESASAKIRAKCNLDLVYYSIDFCCVHGGKDFKSRGTGKRPKQR